jgi:hypothetical protein
MTTTYIVFDHNNIMSKSNHIVFDHNDIMSKSNHSEYIVFITETEVQNETGIPKSETGTLIT